MEEVCWGGIHRAFTPEEKARWEKAVAETEAELPELIAQHELIRAKAAEPTLSGRLRRAIHTSGLPMPLLAERTSLDQDAIYAFLRGEQSLPSDAIDRLCQVLGYQLVPIESRTEPKPASRQA